MSPAHAWELKMRHELEIQPVRLLARTVMRLEAAKGQQVTCLEGVVWLTQEHDNRDIILTRGQSFIIDRRGLAVAFALKDAAIAVGAAGHISPAAFRAGVPEGRAA